MSAAGPPEVVARRSPALVRFFTGIMTRRMRGAFHCVRLAREGQPRAAGGRPLIVYLNHPSWWDPALIVVLADRLFPGHPGFGPIDAEALQKYRFMARIGLFPVERGQAGAVNFLRQSLGVLGDPQAILWVTAEGHFTDPRRRPVLLRPGIAHLARRLPQAILLPLAVEYTFWEESTPEVLVRFGDAVDAADHVGLDVGRWRELLENRLADTMDALAVDSMSRDPDRFETLLGGRVGVGGVYDLWRRAAATLAGRRFHAGHGSPDA